MDYSVPPSYIEATNKEWLPLLAPYLDSTSLCSVALVSIKWHQNLIPWLWGNPASHFGTEGDHVYVALTRFKRTLARARLQVRQLTHTLHLPPAQTELYDRPQYQWLRDVLERLPNLRCLVVSQIPFFDHSALLALRKSSSSPKNGPQDGPPVFPLRLLIASLCENCTPASLGPAFVHFPALTFLDLSYTPAAREENVLFAIGQLNQLQILKLQKVGLRDADFSVLVEAFERKQLGRPNSQQVYRLRSLDVRDNYLTDTAVGIIVSRLIHHDRQAHSLRHTYERRPSEGDWSQVQAPTTARTYDQLREPELDKHFIRTLTQPCGGRAYLEDLDLLGLTHLYISNNLMTTNALLSLIKTRNLHVLDAGDLDAARSAASSVSKQSSRENILEQLTHALEDNGGDMLTYLRIDHAVVTTSAGKIAQEVNELDAMDAQLPNVHEVHGYCLPKKPALGQPQAVLPAGPAAPSYELPARVPIYAELAGDSISEKPGPATQGSEKLGLSASQQVEELSSLPEVVQESEFHGESSMHTLMPLKVTKFSQIQRPDASFEITRLVGKRKEMRHGIRNEKRGLLPGLLPAMQTLALTGVPPTTRTASVIENLKDFFADCAREQYYASEQACLEHFLARTHESSRGEAIRVRVKEIFALRTVILELQPQKPGQPSEAKAVRSPNLSLAPGSTALKPRTQSVINDRDTDTLWEAAKNDFSFFDDEECGVPASDANSQFPISSVPEKIVLSGDASESGGGPLPANTAQVAQDKQPQQPLRDVVTEIARWRAERRRAHEIAPHGTFVPGFWPGEIKIIRPNLRSMQAHVKYYDSYFEKGVYR